MSCYHSDKCTKKEADDFKTEVMKWFLEKGFSLSKKIKAYTCYNGDVRIYTGECMEFENRKSSFRRTEPEKNTEGKIIGWHGTRGKHSTKIVNYISINRDEWDEIKKAHERGMNFTRI